MSWHYRDPVCQTAEGSDKSSWYLLFVLTHEFLSFSLFSFMFSFFLSIAKSLSYGAKESTAKPAF